MAKIEKIKILKETNNWLAIHKPAFVPSTSERGKQTQVPVIEWAKERYKDAILCHRIDRETSGVLLIAKNQEAHRHIAIQFEQRTIKKTYHAVVDSQINWENLEVDLPINTDNLKNIRIDKNTGKPALTIFNTLDIFKYFTLMECKPQTGRLHQIRVHLASQNASIAGDIKYGSRLPMFSKIKSKFNGEDKPLISRFALHAFQIGFKDLDNQEIIITADYSNDFKVLVKQLRKYNAL